MQNKTCPRCGKPFICHHDDDILLCQCAQIQLTEGARLYMHLHFDKQCLCLDCLRQLNEMFPNTPHKE